MPESRPPHKSKYTADRNIPGAFDGETVTRRRFMVGSTHLMGAAAVSAFALPALGFALGPVFERGTFEWQDIGLLFDINQDTYVPRTITIVPGIGNAGKSTAYLRLRNEGDKAQGIPPTDTDPEDGFNHVVALSTRCMHLGCPVRFVEAAGRFVCPCHGGVYDFTGRVSGGPPVRPLDRFYTRLRIAGPPTISLANGATLNEDQLNNRKAVQFPGEPKPRTVKLADLYPRAKHTGGTPPKDQGVVPKDRSRLRVELGPRYSVNSELRRFSPRDPGEPLDGIGQYLYPARFSTPKK